MNKKDIDSLNNMQEPMTYCDMIIYNRKHINDIRKDINVIFSHICKLYILQGLIMLFIILAYIILR